MMPEGGPAAGSATVTRGGVTEARVAAADVMTDLRAGELLDSSFERRATPLDARDRRWTQELLYGTLRRRGWIDAVLDSRVRGGLARLDPELVDVMRLGVYQLLFMGSVPPYAAIAQSVELAKRRRGIGASKLANAVLRRIDRERGALAESAAVEGDVHDPIDLLAVRHSHPRWLVARWVTRWGLEETEALLRANNREAPLILRPFGVVREQLEAALERSGVATEEAPLLRDSLRLVGAVSLSELGAYRQGIFFVQDPAATLVGHYAAFPSDSVIADVSAAPGGKSLELSRRVSTIIATDRSFSRMQRMRENLKRVDARNVMLAVMDAKQPALRPADGEEGLDGILIDAPCTGTGTFRRHPDARWRLKVSDIAVVGALQRELLDAAAPLVPEGGLLVYATCSLEPEENEEQVRSFLTRHPEFQLELPPPDAVPAEVVDDGYLRVLPQRHHTDGAFAARLRRVPRTNGGTP